MLYTTLANVKDELQLTDSSRDTFISRLIAQASGLIERHVGASYGRANQVDIVPVRRSVRYTLRLVLPRRPIIAVTSITLTDDGTTVDPSLWAIDDKFAGTLYRADGWSGQPAYPTPTNAAFFNDRQPIETRYSITYDAGYDDPNGAAGSPASPLPADLERACIETVKDLWFAAQRDPRLKLVDVSGVVREEYWVGSLSGGGTSGLSDRVVGILHPWTRAGL